MRDFVAALERAGHLTRVKQEVDWKYGIGDMLQATHTPLLFENIRGYAGSRLFTNGLLTPRAMNIALGLAEHLPSRETARFIARGFANPITPVLVENGPVKENLKRAGDIDLLELPIPWWNRQDGARYLATWHLNVSRDPQSGIRNVGVYRMMVLGKDAATVSFSPRGDLARHVAEAEKHDRPLEMAVAIGVNERLMMAAAAAPPYGVDEYGLAGGLAGKPIELVRCATISQEVPAGAEIVIEGVLEPGSRVSDGPYMDYAGIPNSNPRCRVFRASGLLYRTDPIFRGTSVGRPGAEDHRLYATLARIGYTDFHGSRLRHRAQVFLLKRNAFRLFQLTGRVGKMLRQGME